MNTLLSVALLVVFLVHLVVFARLGVRRRQGYYLALVITFSLLSAMVLVRLLAPEWSPVGGRAVHEWLRYGAWAAAVVSISWTLWRLVRRRLHAGRQNCS